MNSNRYSRQRERLLEILRSTETYPTATWLYEQLKRELPGLRLVSVNRNLAILIEKELAKKIDAGQLRSTASR